MRQRSAGSHRRSLRRQQQVCIVDVWVLDASHQSIALLFGYISTIFVSSPLVVYMFLPSTVRACETLQTPQTRRRRGPRYWHEHTLYQCQDSCSFHPNVWGIKYTRIYIHVLLTSFDLGVGRVRVYHPRHLLQCLVVAIGIITYFLAFFGSSTGLVVPWGDRGETRDYNVLNQTQQLPEFERGSQWR
jgi:hypothetical protein